MIVLDTHIWHWWTNQIPGRLPSGIVDLIEQADEVAVSAISVFEMAWLVRHGRIELGGEFEQWLEDVIESDCVKFLPVTPPIASLAVALPEHHKDPQDRLIIATALIENARLLSFDTAFPAYLEMQGRLIGRDY
ncbi:type II toxin-antitoxin system VapC family toxin [Methylomonas sp. MK1]|uniref:type II toxin-antitoxin system VapC family toxin n=1 Tax=Methylomonas sp. MK1 TaxID=1131552 RepID=UPI000381BC5C|nr:type II toxin-antitoxin system VapC family toxin [Methylomonas sp. MK1]